MTKKTIKVCTGGACTQNLSRYILERAQNDKLFFELEELEIEECPCQGKCQKGPNVIVSDEKEEKNKVYNFMTPLEMSKIIKEEHHLSKNSSKKHKK